MNVSYVNSNTEDAARVFGVTPQCVGNWCRKGYLKYIDVSEIDSNRPRYMIPDEEILRVDSLIKTYGLRKWFMYNHTETKVEKEEFSIETKVEETKEREERFMGNNDEDQIMLVVAKIRDFNEELEDLKGREKQVEGEIELLKQELDNLIFRRK